MPAILQLTTLVVTALLAATGATALSAIVPPNNPSSNGKEESCYDQEECLTYINNVRANQEGLDPIKLPSNWDSLTCGQRLFTFMNLERTSRGLGPLTAQLNTYSSAIQTAIANDADPEPPAGLSASSIWAGGSDMIPLAAMYGWMYYDGPGGNNLDCTASDKSGCWGHRDNILAPDSNKVDVGCGQDSQGMEGMAAMFWTSSETPAASELVLSWAEEKKDLVS